MMKRLLTTMLTLAAVLTSLQANAAMYILGDYPFGSWVLSDAVQMTDNGDGTYTHTATLSGTMYFVFADGIADDWDTFSNNYRYGPTTVNQGETVNPGEWVTTQKSPTEAYLFRADGAEYTITFDKNNLRFKIEGPAASSFQRDGIYYNVTGPNTVEVTKGSTYGDDYSGDVTIPSSVTYGGVTYDVTAIGANAFLSCHDLTSVNIPTTVTTIGESAFYYCTSLTRVVIPESVMTIGDWNFYCNDQMTTVILPSTLTSLGSSCFDSCPNLSKVTCKATTPPAIGSMGCFSNISNQSTLYVPENSVSAYQTASSWSSFFSSVEAMPEYDFTYTNLKFVITSANTAKCMGPTVSSPSGSWSIPATVTFEGVTYRITEVGQEAFFYCTDITSFVLGSNIEKVDTYAFYGCSGLTYLNLGNVKTIGDCAFGDCSSLTSVTIPNSVTSIGHYGFGGCGLTSITIPASVLQISNGAFYNCPSLTAINMSSSNPNYTSSGGVMFSKDMTALKAYPIGNSATSYSVPEGVTSIQYGAFGYSVNLQSVTLPSTLTAVGTLAFGYCPSLTSVTCLAQTPPTCSGNAFVSTIENSGLTLTVPRGCKSAYQEADGWKNFPTIQERYYDFYKDGIYYNITGENTVEVTSDNEDGGTYSGSVTIPETVNYDGKSYTVTAIGNYAFQYCRNLTAVSLPSTITEIGYASFYSDFLLTSINLPEHLTKIGIYAFYACTSLGNVEIPASVTWLGTYAFCGCSSFTEVVIPSSVTEIDYGAFYSCSSLTKVTLGSSLNDIDEDVFKNCTALETIIIHASTPPSITSTTFMTEHYSNVQLLVPKGSLSAYQSANYWQNFTNIAEMPYDFEKDGIYYNYLGNNKVEVTYMTTDYNSYSGDIIIPETVKHNGVTYTVTRIGYRAFYNCRSLTSVTMPNTLQGISDYAFYHCDELTTVVIPNSVTSIGTAAFWQCLNLEEAIIPNSVTTIGSMAFRNCTAMTRVVIGKNVTSIGSTCFIYNPNITEVICLATTPPTLNDPASGSMTTFQTAVYTNAVLRVPYGSHEAYRNDANWGKFTNIVSEEVINPAMAGDVNGDGKRNISDVTALINLLLSGTASSNTAADVNGDNNVNISDVTALINMLLSGAGGETTPGIGKANYLINSVPFTMVKVDGGTFMMGLEGVYTPVHQVTLSDYYIGETEVTQALWQTVMGSNPSSNKSDVNLPVENMTWDDCVTFATKMSRLTGLNFSLPTEAQWEFAARGGNKSQGYTYAGSNNLNEVAWYYSNSGNKTHVVGTKAPNELGLYDMSGNVFEWIQDYYGSYTSEAQVNPQGPTTGNSRVCRSSAYNRSNLDWFMCGGRTYDSPSTNAPDTGLRLAMDYSVRGDVNCDGVIDENDYAELFYIYYIGQTPLSTYATDVNGDGSIVFDYGDNIQNSDNTALVRILYNGLMKTWNGYPFNDLSNPKYDVNGDGEINRADLNCVVDIILGDNFSGGDMDNDGAVNWRDVCILHIVVMKLNGTW